MTEDQSAHSHLRDTRLILLGMTLGAGLASLLTPRSGSETRRHLRSTFYQTTDHAKQSLSPLAEEAEERIEEARNDITAPDRLAKRDALEEGLGE